MKKMLLATLLLAASSASHAAKTPVEFTFDLGMSNITKDGDSLTGFTSRARLNYYVTPFIAADLSYTDTISISDEFTDSTANTVTSMDYSAINAGVKVNQPLGKLLSVFASGGLSYSTVDEEVYNRGTQVTTKESESQMKPYANLGVSMQTPWDRGLQFSLDYTYQPLAMDYTASYFSVGAHYSF